MYSYITGIKRVKSLQSAQVESPVQTTTVATTAIVKENELPS